MLTLTIKKKKISPRVNRWTKIIRIWLRDKTSAKYKHGPCRCIE